MQRMVAAGAHGRCDCGHFLHRSETKELVEAAQIAKTSGPTVIGITRPGSPLAEKCGVALTVTAPETRTSSCP